MSSLGMLRQFVYKLGPYLMLEALLPGGTLLALLLFLYQGRKLSTRGDAHGPALGVNGRNRASCATWPIDAVGECRPSPPS